MTLDSAGCEQRFLAKLFSETVITPSDVHNLFVFSRLHIDFIHERVRETLQTYCHENQFAFVSRLKTEESLSEKIESGRFASWSAIDDLIGCAVVIPTLPQEEEVLSFLSQAFVQVQIKRKGLARKDPEVFRFDSTRWVGKLKPATGAMQSDPTFNILFEVQVRSAFEHAWSVTTHALTYKSSDVSWSRLRLAALLKAAVEQADTLVNSFEQTSARIIESESSSVRTRVFIISSTMAIFNEGLLPEELRPKDWSRFSDNFYAMSRCKNKAIDIEEMLSALRNELAQPFAPPAPRSISLLQLVFACCVKNRLITPPLRNFVPVITAELEYLYPEVKEFTQRFGFQLHEQTGKDQTES